MLACIDYADIFTRIILLMWDVHMAWFSIRYAGRA